MGLSGPSIKYSVNLLLSVLAIAFVLIVVDSSNVQRCLAAVQLISFAFTSVEIASLHLGLEKPHADRIDRFRWKVSKWSSISLLFSD